MCSYIRPGLAISIPFLGSLPASRITRNALQDWYPTLKKPFFTPPNWLFPPMWSTLYACMGYASYIVWKEGGGFSGEAKLPLALYGSQLALNWAWTPIFFGAHRIGLGLCEISTLWMGIALTIYKFHQVNSTAGYLLVPYLAWVTIATGVNAGIWWLNCRSGQQSDDKTM